MDIKNSILRYWHVCSTHYGLAKTLHIRNVDRKSDLDPPSTALLQEPYNGNDNEPTVAITKPGNLVFKEYQHEYFPVFRYGRPLTAHEIPRVLYLPDVQRVQIAGLPLGQENHNSIFLSHTSPNT
jgi:hypothetical protein